MERKITICKLYVRKLSTTKSLEKLLQTISKFSKVPDYKININ